jgi:hypothetical protein
MTGTQTQVEEYMTSDVTSEGQYVTDSKQSESRHEDNGIKIISADYTIFSHGVSIATTHYLLYCTSHVSDFGTQLRLGIPTVFSHFFRLLSSPHTS